MTITPTAPAPSVLPAAGQDPAVNADPSSPGAFVALVQQALAEALGGVPATPGATTGGQPDDRTGDAGTEQVTVDPALLAAATGLAAVVPPALPAPVTGTTATAGAAAVDAAGTASTTSITSAGAGGGVATVVPPAGSGDPGRAGTDAGTAGQSGRPARDSAPATTTRTTPADLTRGAAEDAPSAPTATQVQPQAPAPAPAAAPSPASSLPAGLTPVVPTPVVVAATATPQPAATQQVTGQVFPEVTSLVSRGDGTHRITLTLKPEALGEVRVVMTVRDGAVHVRLAAGHDAQQALLQGSPELTRLLEHAGATDTRIVVRDLLAGAAPTTGSADPGPDLGQGLGAGGHRPQDEHAGTRAQQHGQHQPPATDGTQGSTTTGANPPRSNESVTSSRAAGVDVTM